PRQVDLLLREFGLERQQTLLLAEGLYLTAIDIQLRDEPDSSTLRVLLIQRVGGLELSARRIDTRTKGQCLQIRPADGEHDEISRVFDRELIGAEDGVGRAVVAPCRQI